MSLYPKYLNPEISPTLQQEANFFMKWGYLVIEEAITPGQVDQLRDAMEEMFARKKSEFCHQLLEEDDRFAFLLDHPPVLARMKAILGACIQLHSATARVTLPGAADQTWHRDGPWPVDPDLTPYGSVPGQINCGYYLDEITAENGLGALCVVPGSHRALFGPPEGSVKFPHQKMLYAKPGQAVLFDGWLFHRGTANQSEHKRRACLMCYQNAWMKSREPFDGPRVTKLRETGSDERKLLLGTPAW
jgi:ectoine hydroxylase-related dioxygenase (phytanoyl-CoA dioxygenase family)